MLRMYPGTKLLRLLLVCAIGFSAPALALTLESPLAMSAQESRAQALFKQVRCMVCQGESIADSPADVASDLRREVRERVESGDSDETILDMLVSHYGESILMKPPLNAATALLWAAPALLLGFGLLLVWRYFRPQPKVG